MFEPTNAKDRLTRLRHGTPVVGYQTVQTQWRLFIPETLENRQVEVISTRKRRLGGTLWSCFLVIAFHLGRDRQVACISQ